MRAPGSECNRLRAGAQPGLGYRGRAEVGYGRFIRVLGLERGGVCPLSDEQHAAAAPAD